MIMHKHHKIPKYVGGSNEVDNIEILTIEEHALAHKNLYEKYGNWQDELAWKGLSGLIGKDEILLQIAKNNGSKISRAKLGKPTWNKGLKCPPLSESHKKNLSIASKGKKKSKSHCLNISKGLKGVPKSLEHRKKLSLANKNQKLTEEQRRKHKAACQGDLNGFHKMTWITNGTENKAVLKTFKLEKHSEWYKGFTHTESARKKISKGKLGNTATKGSVWISNGYKSRMVAPQKIEALLNDGWFLGRKMI